MALFEETKNSQLVVDDAAKAYILETGRWGKFIGLVYMVVLILLTLMFPVVLSITPELGSLSLFVRIATWAISAGFIIYPIYAVLKSAALNKAAIRELDQYKFNRALKITRNLYIYLGVLTIVSIIGYGIMMLLAILMAYSN